ncbi:hypothetical protein QYE76_050218 [Lolium multiflorum]|uniref:Uncharacterized protein n=1 Tax=Lolium multiflorum TaxID=4521 RepID=A0AAD8SQH7_LOLMU|nr:hypothetical protein QYE76_050218 [Lolium multiflorum]
MVHQQPRRDFNFVGHGNFSCSDSESLVNTLERVALRVVQEIMKHQYSPSGPALGTHQGEIPFYTRPPLPFTLAAPQQQGSPAYVVYKISAILRDQFGILPKKRTIGYSKPYPNEYDLIPLPPKYRLPDFTKFSGSEGSSSIEHVSRYLAQLGMVSASDQLRVRFFAQSLTGPAFGWYTSLPPDSVRRSGETVSNTFSIQDVKNRCYSVRLSEKEAVDLAIAGLSAPLKDLTFQADYNSLAHMVQKLTSYEQRHPELYQDKFKRRMSRLPTIENCPECRQQRKGTNEVSVFKRLGPLPPQNKAESSRDEDFEESDEEEDRYHRQRWCPDGLSHSQKRRVQRLRNLEAEAQYLYTLRKARPDLAVKIQQTLEMQDTSPTYL